MALKYLREAKLRTQPEKRIIQKLIAPHKFMATEFHASDQENDRYQSKSYQEGLL